MATVILSMMAAKAGSSVSFRSLSKVFATFNLYFRLAHSSPSFSTTLLWVKKIGKAQLEKHKERSQDWVLIVDQSIGIGQEKLLVILGIRHSHIDFNRPLVMQDMETIALKSKQSWAGQDIANELHKAKEMLGTVIYAVTDSDSTLKKGLRETGIRQVYDVTHAMAPDPAKALSEGRDLQGLHP